MTRNYLLFLYDILTNIDDINKFTENISYKEFVSDSKTNKAVIRSLEIIGECVKHIPDDIKIKRPEIQWKLVASMRDRLIHEYFGIDNAIIWQSIVEDLPPLKKAILSIIDE